ncbi:MAG: hypothetical protein IJW16_08045 [Clostridia bacterium]|nr:hypothetical protein [Clostridia bacterium]
MSNFFIQAAGLAYHHDVVVDIIKGGVPPLYLITRQRVVGSPFEDYVVDVEYNRGYDGKDMIALQSPLKKHRKNMSKLIHYFEDTSL